MWRATCDVFAGQAHRLPPTITPQARRLPYKFAYIARKTFGASNSRRPCLPFWLHCLSGGLVVILLLGCGVGFRLFLRRLFILGLR